MMNESGLSAADVALLNNDGMGGWNGMIWLFAILALMGGGFGWGGNNVANALGYENLATSAEVQRGFDAQNSMAQSRDILSAVTNGTAQTIAASTQNATNAISAIKDGNAALIREFGNVESALTALGGKQQECCCEILRGVDGVNYNGALNTASINASIADAKYASALNTAAINETTTAQTQKILDAIQQNKIESLQAQVSNLELQNQLAGVVRYPMNTMYGVPSPCFGGCGC
jgi:hypothetical protein